MARHRPPYLAEGSVGLRVSVGERGFFTELLPEGVLLGLQDTEGLVSGGHEGHLEPPVCPRSPQCRTSNCWHFLRMMLTSFVCRGATFCFT